MLAGFIVSCTSRCRRRKRRKTWSFLLDEKGGEVRHLSALLYSIARNRVIDHYRSRANRETLPLADSAEEIIADDRMDLKKIDAGIDAKMLAKKMRALKDEYREVLVMKYLDELETSEIALVLGKTHGNVRVLLHRATEALRDLVAPEANTHAEPDRGTIEVTEA